jgi:CheY-like chemotaxis protein
MSGDQTALSGQRVLIVDDEYAFAYEIADTAAKLGARILGPLPTVAAACAVITPEAQIDLVLLDLHFQGEMAWPALDLLQQRGIRVAVTSTIPPNHIPARYADMPLHRKPLSKKKMRRCYRPCELMIANSAR